MSLGVTVCQCLARLVRPTSAACQSLSQNYDWFTTLGQARSSSLRNKQATHTPHAIRLQQILMTNGLDYKVVIIDCRDFPD